MVKIYKGVKQKVSWFLGLITSEDSKTNIESFYFVCSLFLLLIVISYSTYSRIFAPKCDFVIESIRSPKYFAELGINEEVLSGIVRNEFNQINDTIKVLNDTTVYPLKGSQDLFSTTEITADKLILQDYKFEFAESGTINAFLNFIRPKPERIVRLNFSLSDSSSAVSLHVNIKFRGNSQKEIDWFFSEPIKNGKIEEAIANISLMSSVWITWIVNPKSASAFLLNYDNKKIKGSCASLLSNYLNNAYVSRKHKDDSWVYLDLADLYQQLDLNIEAEAYLKTAYLKSKDKRLVLRKLAIFYLYNGRCEEGIDKINQLLKIDSNNTYVKELKAVSFLLRDDIESFDRELIILENAGVISPTLLSLKILFLKSGSDINLIKKQIQKLKPEEQTILLKNYLSFSGGFYSHFLSLFPRTAYESVLQDSNFVLPDDPQKMAQNIFSTKLIRTFLLHYPKSTLTKTILYSMVLMNPKNDLSSLTEITKDKNTQNLLGIKYSATFFEDDPTKAAHLFVNENPYDFGYYLLACVHLVGPDNYDSANFYYKQAIKVSDIPEVMSLSWARTLYLTGHYRESDSIFTSLLQNRLGLNINIYYSDFLIAWSKVLMSPSMSKLDFEKGQNLLVRASSYNSKNIEALNLLAASLLKQKRVFEAINAYECIQLIDSMNTQSYYAEALILRDENQDYLQAISKFRKALQIDSKNTTIWSALLRCYELSGDINGAHRLLNEQKSAFNIPPN